MGKAAYDAIAGWYDACVRASALAGDVVLPPMFGLIGDMQGQAICDLACGQGRIARELARRGARVTGIDLSTELIAIARRDEGAEPLGITYVVDDAEGLASVADASFDGVVCNLALMDISDLAATIGTVWRILRRPGWFVCSITHPCFEAPHAEWRTGPDGSISREISTYFEEGRWFSHNKQGVRGQVGAQHRTLSTYINTVVDAGFAIEHMIEPRADGEAAIRVPGYRVVPAFMLLRCVKLQ